MKTMVWTVLFVIAAMILLVFASLAGAETMGKRLSNIIKGDKKIVICKVVGKDYKGNFILKCEEK